VFGKECLNTKFIDTSLTFTEWWIISNKSDRATEGNILILVTGRHKG
jgi:hypothetical protein